MAKSSKEKSMTNDKKSSLTEPNMKKVEPALIRLREENDNSSWEESNSGIRKSNQDRPKTEMVNSEQL